MKFFSNVIKEMKQVTWPSGKEVNRYTATVVVTVLLAIGFFSVVDYLIKIVIDFLLG